MVVVMMNLRASMLKWARQTCVVIVRALLRMIMKYVHLKHTLLSCQFVYFINFCSCLNALRHPFLCGPRWRVDPPMGMIRWSLGSTAVRITEEYIYGRQQVYQTFSLNYILFFSPLSKAFFNSILLKFWDSYRESIIFFFFLSQGIHISNFSNLYGLNLLMQQVSYSSMFYCLNDSAFHVTQSTK